MEEVLDNTPNKPSESNVSFWPIALRYGAIWGGISVAITLISYLADIDPANPSTSTAAKVLLGLLGFGVSIAAIVMAIREHRDKELGGYITLGRAVLVGLGVGLVAGAIGAVFMILYTTVINPDYAESIMAGIEAQWEEQGMSDEQIDQARQFTGFMFNPVFSFFSQLLGGLISGTLFGLIAGAIMKREPLR